MPTSIDEILENLRESQGLTDSQIKQILTLEQRANASERSADAKDHFLKMPKKAPERLLIQSLLDSTYASLSRVVRAAPSSEHPTLAVVTGAPGSGKSALCEKLHLATPTAVYLCGDHVKREFITQIAASCPANNSTSLLLEKYKDAVHIHRLTSSITWALFEDALKERKNIVLETIGADARSDSKSISSAANDGYDCHLHHVACTRDRAISSAIERFFSTGNSDSGRYISLTNIANKHHAILRAFVSTTDLLCDWSCKVHLYDNSDRKMKEIYFEDTSNERISPPIERFMGNRPLDGLWYLGANRGADLAAFAYNDEGALCVAVASRLKHPHIGMYSMPGGFNYTTAHRGSHHVIDMESLVDTALREFSQKMLCTLPAECELTHVGHYADTKRDARNTSKSWVETDVFATLLDQPITLTPGPDVDQCAWVEVCDVLNRTTRLAFDHELLVQNAMDALRVPLRKATASSAYRHLTAKR